jgi:hypothetical protein
MREDLQKLLIGQNFFEELTEIKYDEIKYGITSEETKKMTSDEIEKSKKAFNFESALNKAQFESKNKIPLRKKTSMLIFNILFAIIFLVILFQVSLWIWDFIFKTNVLNLKIPIINTPLYYSAILLGFLLGNSMAKDSYQVLRENNKRKYERLESLRRLRKLFIECENYNKIIKSIDVKDQIANVLDKNQDDEARKEILSVLDKIHSNLVKALKIDKVLRENEDIITTTRESLEITFAELQYADITQNASQYLECVDEVLALGMSLNQEFKMLHNSSDL